MYTSTSWLGWEGRLSWVFPPLSPATLILFQHPVLLTVNVQQIAAQEKMPFAFLMVFSSHTNLYLIDTTFLVNVKLYRK